MPIKTKNGSNQARSMFGDCPHMSKLGGTASTVCYHEYIRDRQGLINWLKLAGQAGPDRIRTHRNAGDIAVEELYDAAGMQIPSKQGSQGQALANLIVRLDTTQAQLTELQLRHDRLLARFNQLLDHQKVTLTEPAAPVQVTFDSAQMHGGSAG